MLYELFGANKDDHDEKGSVYLKKFILRIIKNSKNKFYLKDHFMKF